MVGRILIMDIKIFHEARFLLSEGSYWSDYHLELFWVDILTRTLCRKSLDGVYQQYELPETLTTFYVAGNVVYGATENGFCSFNLDTKQFLRLIDIELSLVNNRSNDGTADGYGGFIFGTMAWSGGANVGSIYHVNTHTLVCKQLDSGYFIPNGFAFNSVTGNLFIADSYLGHIYCYDYDPLNARLLNKRLFSDIHRSGYSPDGMCLTRVGELWSAEWDGARLARYTPEGQIDKYLRLPVLKPTSCTLDKEERFLYITSACTDMTERQLGEYPCSGSILRVEMK